MKVSERVSCPKCSFAPTFNKEWKLEYKDECYGVKRCGWNDNEVKEHIHKTCPTCGFTMACETADYDKLKGKESWSTAEPAKVTTEPKPLAGGRGGMGGMKPEAQAMANSCTSNRTPVTKPTIVKPATVTQPVFQKPAPVTPVKCRTCPVEADGTPKVKPTV